MTVEEKRNVAFYIIKSAGIESDRDAVLSIANCVKNDRFFMELVEGKIAMFLTWEDDLIDGKRSIFFNNCWVDPKYRNTNRLLKIKRLFRLVFTNVYKFYWHNNRRNKMIERH